MKIFKRVLATVMTVIMLLTALPFAGIDFDSIFASRVSAMDLSSYNVGDTIEFGSYPQSKVNDDETISALDGIEKEWISYRYYTGTGTVDDGKMAPSDIMEYADIAFNGDRYRAIIIHSYRPNYTGKISSKSFTSQPYSTCEKETVYYYKFEPLTWRILDPSEGYVMCSKAIDAQAYNNYALGVRDGVLYYYGNPDKSYYASNWEKCSLRQWLNNDFYNVAFSSDEKASIGTTYNENKSANAVKYDSASTYDKVFLISSSDAKNTSYGFASSNSTRDIARQMQTTDYAHSQGVHIYNNLETNPDRNVPWMFRTADVSTSVLGADYFGFGGQSINTSMTNRGVVPALKFNPKKSPCETHSYSSAVTRQPDCTTDGVRKYTCKVCGDTYTEKIPALGHDYKAVITPPTCTEQGYTTHTCSKCNNSYVDTYIDPLSHSSTWVTSVNPTTTSDGLAEKICNHCGKVIDQFVIPRLAPTYVTGITLSSESETVGVGDSFTLTATIKPDTAENKNVVWSSRNPEIATVENGTVNAVKPGTTAIVAESEDGGFVKFCLVRVVGLTAKNGSVIDNDKNIIYGLSAHLDNVKNYIGLVDDSMSITFSTSTIGTGTTINVVDNGEIIDSYEAVIFGDVNCDGWYDGTDAVLVSMIASGMLTKEQVGEAVWTAADCNHDGVIDELDVALLEQAGLLLANVDQSKSADELKTDSVYIEYLNLIEQNPTDETEPSNNSFIKMIIDFITYIISKFMMIFA